MKNKEDGIFQRENSITLRFAKSGENFSLDVPHISRWHSVINFLKKRGFKITANPYFLERRRKTLSKFHKFGQKGDVIVLLEIGCFFIRIKFGHRKNLWETMTTEFWDNPSDSRYTPEAYLESLAVKLESFKLMNFLSEWNFKTEIHKELSPEAFIIDKLKSNTHLHGVVHCLEDIKNSITEDSYDYKQNSNDLNGKKIICGQTKYFYDYQTKRLSKGVVWHNINNMWWVIGGKSLRNIAAHGLFDFEPSLSRRKINPLNAKRLNSMIDSFAGKRDFRKCLTLQSFGEQYGVFGGAM